MKKYQFITILFILSNYILNASENTPLIHSGKRPESIQMRDTDPLLFNYDRLFPDKKGQCKYATPHIACCAIGVCGFYTIVSGIFGGISTGLALACQANNIQGIGMGVGIGLGIPCSTLACFKAMSEYLSQFKDNTENFMLGSVVYPFEMVQAASCQKLVAVENYFFYHFEIVMPISEKVVSKQRGNQYTNAKKRILKQGDYLWFLNAFKFSWGIPKDVSKIILRWYEILHPKDYKNTFGKQMIILKEIDVVYILHLNPETLHIYYGSEDTGIKEYSFLARLYKYKWISFTQSEQYPILWNGYAIPVYVPECIKNH